MADSSVLEALTRCEGPVISMSHHESVAGVAPLSGAHEETAPSAIGRYVVDSQLSYENTTGLVFVLPTARPERRPMKPVCGASVVSVTVKSHVSGSAPAGSH